MGKGFRSNKPGIAIFILLLFVTFSAADGRASFQELDLFNSGYEYYLSYRPAKAAEEFKTFLAKYPDSSVRDAAMFWFGKSSVQLKDLEEAKKAFSALMQQFPDSPYIKYVKKELESIDKMPPEDKSGLRAGRIETADAERREIGDSKHEGVEEKVAPPENTQQQKQEEEADPAKIEKKSPPAEPEIMEKVALEDKGSMHTGVVETAEKEKRNGIPDIKVGEIENKEPPEDTGQQKMNEEAVPAKVERETPAEAEKIETAPLEDKSSLPPATVETAAQASKIEKKDEPSPDDVKGHEDANIYAADSSHVLSRLDIREVLWRNGNASEDIENEKILYEEARRLNISADTTTIEELVLKYGFNSGQADYFRRFLTICEFLNRKLKDLPEEKVLESLIVKYEEGNKYRKIVISPELQKEAKNGIPFGDIKKLYPDLVSVVITGYDFVEPQLKEKMRYLQNDEVGVIWSEEGYMIIKPALKNLSCRLFEEAGPDIRDKIKAFIIGLLTDLRRSKKTMDSRLPPRA